MIDSIPIIDEQSGVNGESTDLHKSDGVVDQPDKIDKQPDRQIDLTVESSDSDDEISDIQLLNYNGDVKGDLVGVRAKDWQDLFQLYKDHSNALGFIIKKGTAHKYKSGKLSDRYFQCNCYGQTSHKRSTKKGSAVKTPTPVQVDKVVLPSPVEKDQTLNKQKRKRRYNVFKTGCKAQMRVKWIKKDDVYEVVLHEVTHNHEMTGTYWNHLKKSERSISNETGALIERFIEAGIRPKDGYNMLVKSAGGEEFVGHTKRDYQNFVNKLKIEKLEKGDAQNVVNRLTQCRLDDPSFYFDISFGEDSRLENIFWRDSMMKHDFDLYGDVVIFDTTYNTNKYNLICAPIVGINNHWNTVMFGCAFLSNKTEESFKWLLNTFVKSMGGKKPTTIFTDQDQAMANAIKEVFKERTRHRLCLWHIQQNAAAHFGKLKSDENFKAMFDHCLMGCTSKEEFEQCWNEMMDKYNLREVSWFNRLYGFRDKWCTALSKDFFSAEILSSQRSESTNHAICFEANMTTSLTGFLDIFNNTVQRWRSIEQKKEYESINYKPRPEMYGGIVKHASEVYTLEIYKFFEHEAKASFAAPYRFCGYRDPSSMCFLIAHEKNPTKFETVTFQSNSKGVTVDCSCNHFNEVGWLCFHCIKALNLNNIDCIPEKYIVKRWTKKVKMDIWDTTYQGRVTTSTNLPETLPWMQFMARKFYDLMMICREKPAAKRIIEDSYNATALEIQQFMSSNRKGSAAVGSTTFGSDKTVVIDPHRSVSKGRKKQQKMSKFDRKKPLTINDFSTSKRNEHLI